MFQYAAQILKIKDADSFSADIDLGFSVHVHADLRLDGLDAPEIKTVAGKDVKAWVQSEVARHGGNCIVTTRKDKTEKYGRMLAVVHFVGESVSLNQALLDSGRAKAYSGGKRT